MSKPRPAIAGQLSLFNTDEKPDAFRKAVQVVHSKPKSPLSLLNRKLGNAWLKHAIENPPDSEGWWELGIKKLALSIGFDSNNRQYLKESAEALMRVVFEWDVMAPMDKRVQWKASVLFPEIEIRNDAIRYQISSQMRDRMINPDIYALIDMNIVRRFRRAPSLAIWEFCVRFERIGKTAAVDWRIFRDMVLGESPENKTYDEYKYFKSKVVNPAVAEINSASNHTIALIEEKMGKRVSTIRFAIQRKVSHDVTIEHEQASSFVKELVSIGVPPSEARKLTAQNSLEEVKGALAYTRRRMVEPKLAKLAIPAAYFRQALSNRYAPHEAGAVPKDQGAPPAGKSVDIKESYANHLLGEAECYFNELDAADQTLLMQRYDAQQALSALRLGVKVSKLSRAAFLRWLCKETWGEPSADELLEFAQRMLEAKQHG